LIQQIDSRKKVEHKLPTWFQNKVIFYPPKLNLEQTSSEITAKYKATIFKGAAMADLTGGFGVDSLYFSKQFNAVTHFEKDTHLSAIAQHNFNQLSVANIECVAKDGLNGIANHFYDMMYLDPSRRHRLKGKVVLLSDCEPNVPEQLNYLFEHTHRLLVKTSPMLDISKGIKELDGVSEIHIVAVNNEVKELLWLLKKEGSTKTLIKTVNIRNNDTQHFKYFLGEVSAPLFSAPKKYLYEPNAAVMKSGAFDIISDRYSIPKLHQNSHLYTSTKLKEIPGRRFLIKRVYSYNKRDLKEIKALKKANISTRNFPESVANLRKKLKITDGGDSYLFFTTDLNNNKIVIDSTKA